MVNEKEIARDAAIENVFAERDRLTARARKLDIVEQLFNNLADDELDAMLELSDLVLRAGHARIQRVNQEKANERIKSQQDAQLKKEQLVDAAAAGAAGQQ